MDIAEIVKFEDEEKYGLAHRYIFGLNLFDGNDVKGAIHDRLDALFLTHLTLTLRCSAQVSAVFINDQAESPTAIFGPPTLPSSHALDAAASETPYFLVDQTGFRDGYFDLEGGITFNGRLIDGTWVEGADRYGDCFFPLVTSKFWESLEREEGTRDQLMIDHSLALYIGPKGANAPRELERCLNADFVGESHILHVATEHYGVVLLAGHDGQYWHAFARDVGEFEVIVPSLAIATDAIVTSDWFRANRERLVWDAEYKLCPMRST